MQAKLLLVLKLLEEQLGGGGQPLFDATAGHVFKWENVKYGEAHV